LIEAAYTQASLPVWTKDEAGPYQTIPYPGSHWHPAGQPVRYPHEYVCAGMAKHLTLFHPASGQVRVKGFGSAPTRCSKLEAELTAILATLPEPEMYSCAENRRCWERWQEGLSVRITLPESLPPLQMLLVLDNLTGHYSVDFVLWLFAHGIMPLCTPLGGSGLNMAESIQRILKRRDGQHPTTPEEIIAWLEAAAHGWSREPTPFIWGGKRQARRAGARQSGQGVGGSGAWTRRPLTRSGAA
jgi:hypothetical protein